MAILSRLIRLGNYGLSSRTTVIKRWSGHNAMDITPTTTFAFRFIHNWMHFYFIIAAVPLIAITAYVDIRANPELTDAPEGYEPRYFEYYKNPITRFIARYLFDPMELEHELIMADNDFTGEKIIRKKVISKCEKVMQFYNDHRSLYFIPYYAESYRSSRDLAEFKFTYEKTETAEYMELAYDQTARPVVPVEGFTKSGPPRG